MPHRIETPSDVLETLQEALGWTGDPVIDLDKDGCSDSLQVSIKADKLVGSSLRTLLAAFSRAAIKFQEKCKKIPVLNLDV